MAKLILRADVSNVGKRGDVVEVADGFARNYLLPRGLAIVASDGAVAQAASMRRARDLRESRDRSAAQTIAATLTAKALTMSARARGDKLFGSIGPAEIVTAVKSQFGVELERRQVNLADHIRTTGDHPVPVRLHHDVTFDITVTVSAAT